MRDPQGANVDETLALVHQANDMRQRVIGVIIAGALIEHNRTSAEPILETLVEFFKVLSEKVELPPIEQIEAAIKQAEELEIPEEFKKELYELLERASKRKQEIQKTKIYVMNWAKRTIGAPELTYAEAAAEIPQWAYLPGHKKIVGVEADLYRVSRQAAYGLVVAPVFEAKYGTVIREKIIEDEFKDNFYFDILFRIMDTPRITAYGADNYPGAIEWLQAAFEERFKEDNLLIAQTLLNVRSLPVQYLDSFIYRWFRGQDLDKRVKDKEVLKVIEATRSSYRKLMDTVNPEEIYHIIKDKIWPEFKKLIDTEITQRREMEMFWREHQDIDQPQLSKVWNSLTDAERQQIKDEIERQWKALSSEEQQEILDQIRNSLAS